VGNVKWTSGIQSVTTSDGLFNYVLGSNVSFPAGLFVNDSIRYLGITVDPDPEIAPRTRLTTSAYSFTVETVDGATGGTITGETSVTGSSNGNQFSVSNTGLGRGGFFQMSNPSNTESAVQGTHVGGGPGGSFFSDGGGPGIVAWATAGNAGEFGGNVLVDGDQNFTDAGDTVLQHDVSANTLRNYGSDGNGENWRLWGNSFGQVYLYDNEVSNDLTVIISAFSDGGELDLKDGVGSSAIVLDASTTGDVSAIVPVNAINAGERLDEPGVASNKTGIFDLSGVDQTVLSRTIDAPAAGYVFVIASGSFSVGHTNGVFSQGYVFVSETEGTATNKPRVDYEISSNAPTGTYTSPYSVQGVFQVSAGNNTFYLRGHEFFNDYILENNRLTLAYFSTAYGFTASNAPAISEDSGIETLSSYEEIEATTQLSSERLAREVREQKRQIEELQAAVAELQQVQVDR
jgi:hypothetical protein